jgi:hypothetical protein
MGTMDAPLYRTSKPYTRWWWFAGPIRREAIRAQLEWVRANGFGGVEIAWVYPLPGSRPGPRWLAPEWAHLVSYAKRCAESLGLGCDFTCGTLWPFGGSIVEERDAAQSYTGLAPQRLLHSWEQLHAEPGYILNHLSRHALERYARQMGAALAPALSGAPSALFCDSWEVETDGLWTTGFDDTFRQRYGYDILPYMPALDDHPDVRYDYRRLIAAYVLGEFYRPLSTLCRALGGFSRVQAHGAPADLLACYAAADVPESEAILFDPHFSQFAASAAALAGRPIISAEAFTCLYGWTPRPGPAPYIKRERPADLRLLADALFANGVNMIVWHGMPYNPPGAKTEFYASVHVGPDGALAEHIPALNEHMATVSAAMRRGCTYSDVAVYLPLEDNWMRGELPEELRRPSAKYHWELQHQRFPAELAGYRPLWVSADALPKAAYVDGVLHCGEARFSSLYVDVEWLEAEALAEIRRLARQGLPVWMRKRPAQPGRAQSAGYECDLDALLARDSVRSNFAPANPPLVEGRDLPEFWCRVDGDEAVLFFAHPASRGLTYPLRYGQAEEAGAVETPVVIHWGGRQTEARLAFAPQQSLLVQVSR